MSIYSVTCGWMRRGHLFIIMDGNDFFFRHVRRRRNSLSMFVFIFFSMMALCFVVKSIRMTIVRWINGNFLLIVWLEKLPCSNGMSHILWCIYCKVRIMQNWSRVTRSSDFFGILTIFSRSFASQLKFDKFSFWSIAMVLSYCILYE